MSKLHLGCGAVHLSNYVNIDRRAGPAVDVVADIATLTRYEPGSVEEIYACHCLDHFDRWTYKKVLARWAELLQPGGVLRLSMPDFNAICHEYQWSNDLADLQGILYARQDYEGNVRHFIWDFKMAKAEQEAVGLTDVQRYDWFKTPFAKIDDCSQAYLPRGDKMQGRLMSLNITAVKP